MSKKDIINKAISAAAESEHPEDDRTLELSEEGKKREKVYNVAKIVSAYVTNRDRSEYNDLEDQLRDIVVLTKRGEYDKVTPPEKVEEFIHSYRPSEIDTNTQSCALAKQILMIGKSFYEYSDKEFVNDKLYDELLSQWKKFHVEPTGLVPTDVPGREKVKIRFPALTNNLDKAYRIGSTEELPAGVKEQDSVEAFLDRTFAALELKETDSLSLIVSPKIDGVSVNAVVSEGRMTSAASRGDADSNMRLKGLEGEQLTKQRVHDPIAIQFEAFVSKENCNRLAKKTGTVYKNCRSAASGIINRLSADPDARPLARFLGFYPINCEEVPGYALEMAYPARINYIQKFGRIPKDMPEYRVISGNKKELLKLCRQEFEKLEALRASLSFDIDGMVISVLNDEYQKTLGRTGRTNLWQIAMKFNPETAVGIVKGVTVSCGNKGSRTIMVDLVKPAVIDGVEYPVVAVLSAGSYNDLGLRVGSKIEVIRTGDVIPTFTMIEPGNGDLLPKPDTCPSCGEKLEESNGRLRCQNDNCPANIVGRFVNLFEVLGMDNYSEAFATDLLTKVKVDNLDKLLDMTADDLKSAGVTGKLEDQFVERLHSTLEISPDYLILAALGFNQIGKEKAIAILSSIDVGDLDTLTVQDIAGKLTAQGGFKATAERFAETLIQNRELIKKWFSKSKMGRTNFKALKTIGHSGVVIPNDILRTLQQLGWRETQGQRFDALVISDINYTSRKVAIAKKKNLPVITLDELQRMYDNGSLSELLKFKLTAANASLTPEVEVEVINDPNELPSSLKSVYYLSAAKPIEAAEETTASTATTHDESSAATAPTENAAKGSESTVDEGADGMNSNPDQQDSDTDADDQDLENFMREHENLVKRYDDLKSSYDKLISRIDNLDKEIEKVAKEEAKQATEKKSTAAPISTIEHAKHHVDYALMDLDVAASTIASKIDSFFWWM